MFAALSDPAGVIAHRVGALERVQLLLEDWRTAHDRLADTEVRMTGVLDELGLTALVTSITGISAVGAAAILAQTGDPRRFATARALVKHAGLAPREKPVRHLRRPHQTHRPRPTRTTPRGLARSLGSTACQPRLRRPLPPPDQP
jgi:transposase